MSPLRALYLALAAWGAVHPALWTVRQLRDSGLRGLAESWTATAGSTGLAWDLAIAGTALVVWIVAETRVRRNWTALWAIPAICLLGPGCGLPLYLFLRTRPV